MYFPESMDVRIIAEPGRFYVASAFTLAVNVIARREISSADNVPDGNFYSIINCHSMEIM